MLMQLIMFHMPFCTTLTAKSSNVSNHLGGDFHLRIEGPITPDCNCVVREVFPLQYTVILQYLCNCFAGHHDAMHYVS